MRRGFEVFPVNPKETHIEGLAAFKSIADVAGVAGGFFGAGTMGRKILGGVAAGVGG